MTPTASRKGALGEMGRVAGHWLAGWWRIVHFASLILVLALSPSSYHRGNRAAMARHGLRLDDDSIFSSTPNETGGYQIARELLARKERPTAIVLVNETIVIGLYRGLQEAGVMPGRDIAVIGRQSPNSNFLSPRLTSFRLSLHDLGEALAEALLATMPDYAKDYPQGAILEQETIEITATTEQIQPRVSGRSIKFRLFSNELSTEFRLGHIRYGGKARGMRG